MVPEHNLNINGGRTKSILRICQLFDQMATFVTEKIPMNVFQPMQNLTHSLFKWLDIEVNTKYVYTKLDNPLYVYYEWTVHHDVVRMWPTMPFSKVILTVTIYAQRKIRGNLLMEAAPSPPVIITFICSDNLFFILKNWNIYAKRRVTLGLTKYKDRI